jgi:UrcA family protein
MHKFAIKILVLGGLAGLSLAGTALAATDEGMERVATVRYTESSLASDEGTRALYSRLAKAAEKVCPVAPVYAHVSSTSVLACRQKALSAAVSKIHNQRLAALHAATAKAG